MTTPGDIGDAYINVRGRTDKVGSDIERGLEGARPEAEKESEKVGRGMGDRISDGAEWAIRRRGRSIGKAIGDAVEEAPIDVTPNFRYNVRGRNGRFISRAAQGIAEEVEEAFTRSAADSGFLGRFRAAVADAVGAGFNVSGRSPLIVGLIPVIGAIVGLVGAALQAINAVAATLTTIPALLVAIGLQAGILMLAFKGIGTAVTGAFAAKNAKELIDAVKDLTPAGRAFVLSLLPLKGLFEDLQFMAQEFFFRGLSSSVTDVFRNINLPLRKAFADISLALGQSIASILAVFAGPEFKDFLYKIIPATTEWLRAFGPGFAEFLLGLINLSKASIPFLSILGRLLNAGLDRLGQNLTELSQSKGFQDWLDSMLLTLKDLGPLIAAAFAFIVQFLKTLDEAGGRELINSLTDVLVLLTAFIASEAGMRSLNELIGIAIASFYILAGAATALLFLLASVQAFIDWLITDAIPSIGHFFSFIGGAVVDFFRGLVAGITRWFNELLDQIRNLPKTILSYLGNFGTLLLNSGKQLISGLLQGIRDSIPGLKGLLNTVTNLLPQWKGPEDKDKAILKPAGRAVMQGFGEGIALGARDIQSMLGDFTTGMGAMAMSSLNNQVVFGSNAVQVNFRGALPTQDQALNTGLAVGAGISDQLAARNTRLAVRTL